jgi:hypothetical protein
MSNYDDEKTVLEQSDLLVYSERMQILMMLIEANVPIVKNGDGSRVFFNKIPKELVKKIADFVRLKLIIDPINLITPQ